ncbi:MAG: hypothetical protein ACJ8FM_02525, partial [Xanthobacteraceae bacterium]
FGQVIPAVICPAALAALHSAPHARSRAIMASRPPPGVAFAGAGRGICAGAGRGAGAAGEAVGAAADRAKHSFWKARYAFPEVWFAAFIAFHSSAQAFMRVC